MDKGEDMRPFISPHLQNFISVIDFDLERQVAEIKDLREESSRDQEEADEEADDLEGATEVLKEQLELVDSKANTLKPNLRSALKKPIPAKEYPKDSKCYDLLPFGYSLPEHGPEPPSPSRADKNELEYIHLDTGATVVCTNS